MAYEKRVCVLKQVKKGFSADGSALSGAVYAERLGDELTVTPKLLGIAPVEQGRYALAVWADGQVFVLDLKGNTPLTVSNAPSLAVGFAAALLFVKGEAEVLAYGHCGAAPADPAVLLGALSEKKRPVPTPLPPTELPAPFSPNNVPLAPGIPVPGKEEEPPFRERYDDEAIAEADYFGGGSVDADGGARAPRGEEEKAGEDGEQAHGDAARDLLSRPRGTLTYYETVRERIMQAFASRPRDERLKGVFPYSDWVNAGERLLGVVYSEGVPRYLCVAAEAKGEPPEDMREHAMFVPLSPFSEEEGFYIVFQSADTGEYIEVSQD